MLQGIQGVLNISDDILVHGTNQEKHDESLAKVLNRLHERNATLNKEKCEFSKESIEFYGHIFSKNGVSPDPKKVTAIKNATPPQNSNEVASLLGLANYCSRFIPNLADLVAPLRKLTRQDQEWHWGPEEDASLEALKNALYANIVTSYYDTSQNAELLVDASPVGLGAILAQNNRVIAYASKSLTAVEQRYSQTEREALAIAWGCHHFRLYLLGSHFTIVTDHKPLVPIFNKPRSNPPARIANWIFKLQNFNFSVIYRRGKDNPADYMSRHVHDASPQSTASESAESYVNFIATHATPKAVTLAEIKKATKADRTLQTVAAMIRSQNWNCISANHDSDMARDIKIFKNLRDELTVSTDDDVILRGSRLVVPAQLRERIVHIAHEGHQGLVKSKALIREKVWFPRIDEYTERVVKNCMECQVSQTQPTREPLEMSELPSLPWQEVSIDFCEIEGKYILVVIDDYSRYPVIELLTSTSAKAVIPRLDSIFSTFGIPSVVRSDNGPPFNSNDFKLFAEYLGFAHRKVTPLWPEANGEVERFMRTLKKTLRTAVVWKQDVHKFLRNYRATPHTTTGVPPATALFGRPIKVKMPEITKSTSTQTTFSHQTMRQKDKAAKDKMKTYADQRRKSHKSPIKIGDTVFVKQKIKSKLDTPYDKKPLIVNEKKGSMVTASREGKRITRNSSHFKLVSPQPNEEVDYQDYDLPGDLAESSLPDKDTTISPPDESSTARRYPTRLRTSPQRLQDHFK